VLTKPIGTGILTTALKRGLMTEADLAEAIAAMTTLNDQAARLALEHGARAATDVTGFGLIGHLASLLAASGVGAEVGYQAIPLFSGVTELANAGVVPGGSRRNLEVSTAAWSPDLAEAERLIASDAQTSGGLLLSVPPERGTALLEALRVGASPSVAIIGRVVAEPGLRVRREVAWS
jgi:selenide,water dikinase